MKTNKEVQFQVISTIEFMQKQLGVEVTEDNLIDLIENQLGIYGLEYDDEDVMTIQRGLESRLLIKHTTGISIDNDSEIRDWYSNYDADNEYFWPRYKNYLTRDMKLDPKSIDILENKTLVDLMNYVADPRKDSSEKALRRGLVIGDVQSGKTSTYTGLICKAADAGYNVVILLTGVTETLRKQTQERIEEGVIGRSVKIEKIGGKTQRIIKPVGVGKDNLHPPTTHSSAHAGTHHVVVVPAANVLNGELILILVVSIVRGTGIVRACSLAVIGIGIIVPIHAVTLIAAVFHGP